MNITLSNTNNYYIKKLKIALIAILAICLMILGINLYIIKSSEKYIYKDISELPESDVVLVLGAFTYKDRISLVLEDRVVSGIDILKQNKSKKILLTGDHSRNNYDEVNNMRKYVQKNAKWLDKNNIFLDHAGFDTYDSMYRAKEIFEIKKVIIVTQNFHINRSVFIARSLGIDAVGYSVNQDKYPDLLQLKWKSREILSRVKAFRDVIFNSQPIFLGEKIPITGSGIKSWDQKH
jgi:SanA protein